MRISQSLWTLVPMFDHLHGRKKFPNSKLQFLLLQLMSVASHRINCACPKSLEDLLLALRRQQEVSLTLSSYCWTNLVVLVYHCPNPLTILVDLSHLLQYTNACAALRSTELDTVSLRVHMKYFQFSQPALFTWADIAPPCRSSKKDAHVDSYSTSKHQLFHEGGQARS